MSRLEEINSVIQTYCDQLERKRCYIDKAEILALANLVEATANYKMAYRCMESQKQ